MSTPFETPSTFERGQGRKKRTEVTPEDNDEMNLLPFRHQEIVSHKKKKSSDDEKKEQNRFRISSDREKLTIINWSGDVENALKDIGDDDPGVTLDWYTNALNAAIIQANATMPALPNWMAGIAYPIDAQQLQDSIINELAGYGGGRVGRFLVAPNTLAQVSAVRERLIAFAVDPFFTIICAAANQRPLARIFVHADGARKATAVHMGPINIVGVDVFD